MATRFVAVMVLVGLMLVAAAVPASAAQPYPDVAKLVAFSHGADYMSLVGYLRWLDFEQVGKWIARADAVRIVLQEQKPSGLMQPSGL